MKKIGFIGASDKINLIMYVAKAIQIIGNRVIVVDTTMTQKLKYIIPSINPTRTYVTDFENIDFAVGMKSLSDITEYLRINEENLPYDYMLVDIDHEKALEYFGIENTKTNYFVTAFDMYSLKRGVEILKNIQEPMNLSKILNDYTITRQDEEFLNYLTLDTKVAWNEFDLYLNVSGYDKQIIEENQRVQRIRFKKLSADYIEGVLYIVRDIVQDSMEDFNLNRIKKMIKE